jgi:hypothetical protein
LMFGIGLRSRYIHVHPTPHLSEPLSAYK